MPIHTDSHGSEQFVDPVTGHEVSVARLFAVAMMDEDAGPRPAQLVGEGIVVAEDGVPWNITASNIKLWSADEWLRNVGSGSGGLTADSGPPAGDEWSEKRKLAAIRAYETASGRKIDDLAAVMAGKPV